MHLKERAGIVPGEVSIHWKGGTELRGEKADSSIAGQPFLCLDHCEIRSYMDNQGKQEIEKKKKISYG